MTNKTPLKQHIYPLLDSHNAISYNTTTKVTPMYTLKELYDAITASKQTIAGFTVSDELEPGAGSIYFTKDTSEAKFTQIYASPAYDEFEMNEVFKLHCNRHVTLPIQAIDEDGQMDEHCMMSLLLTGNLENDLERYFSLIKVGIWKLEMQAYARKYSYLG